MNINEIIDSGVNLTVSMNYGDLREILKEAIEETKREIEEAVIMEKSETYLSPKQVCELLDVDPSTLFRWRKKAYLVPITIGGKVKYCKSDIKSLMKGGKA